MTALARTSDPSTSHAAAALVNRPESQRLVLDLLTVYGPSTDERLAAYMNSCTISPSRLRTARCELQRAGLVRDTGRVATLRSGRSGVVWECVP